MIRLVLSSTGCCLLLLLLLSRNKLEDSEPARHLLQHFIFRGCMRPCPCSKLELAYERPLNRLQSQAELNQALELRRQRADLRVESARYLLPKGSRIFNESRIVLIFSCCLLEGCLAGDHVEKDYTDCEDIGLAWLMW